MSMHNFRYVTKKEWKPVKEELLKLIKLVQDEVREYFTFQFEFIGSASRNTITIDEGSNRGYDFDVNLRVNDPDDNYSPQEIKQILITAFNKYGYLFEYDYAEDSKRVITIKVKDRKNSRILHSCDFAVIFDCDDGRQQYIHFNKKQGTYSWEYQPKGFYHLKERMDSIKKYGLWEELKGLYLDKKNMNTDQNKKSRSIWAEAVNEIYNQNFED